MDFRVDCVKKIGALPVLKRFCDRLGLKQIIDELLPIAPQATATHGDALVALLMNKLSCPQPLYRIQKWAEDCATKKLLGISPSCLSDDRLGRLLEGLADQVETIKGAVCLNAIKTFGLDVGRLHWDLTSVQFTGTYDEQDPRWPLLTYGYDSLGTGKNVQARVANLVVGDGAVGGLLHKTYPGNQSDQNAVLDYISLFCEIRDQVGKQPRIVGDTKLLSPKAMVRIEEAGLRWICPEPSSVALEELFSELVEDGHEWPVASYVSERERDLPADKRTIYKVREVDFQIEIAEEAHIDYKRGSPVDLPPPSKKGGRPRRTRRRYYFRRVVVFSSEVERAQRTNRRRQLDKVKSKLEELREKFRSNWWKRQSQTRACKGVETVLKTRGGRFFSYNLIPHDEGGWDIEWQLDQETLSNLERLDGLYSLTTNIPASDASVDEILRDYKKQNDVERRFADWKGPLSVRPVFLKNNKRVVGLILVLALALLVFCLIEREVRRQLPEGKLQGLLPVNRPVKATGRNILQTLGELTIVGLRSSSGYHWQAPEPNQTQARLLELLGTNLTKVTSRLQPP